MQQDKERGARHSHRQRSSAVLRPGSADVASVPRPTSRPPSPRDRLQVWNMTLDYRTQDVCHPMNTRVVRLLPVSQRIWPCFLNIAEDMKAASFTSALFLFDPAPSIFLPFSLNGEHLSQ